MSSRQSRFSLRKTIDKPKSKRKAQLNRIYERDEGICQHCMLPCTREDASRGHIIDLEYCDKELARDDNNIQLEHKACNLEKDREKQRQRYIPQPKSEPLLYTIGDYLRDRLGA